MNMSYCRMRNTAIDLQDCYDEWEETEGDEEIEARQQIIELAKKIVENYGDES